MTKDCCSKSLELEHGDPNTQVTDQMKNESEMYKTNAKKFLTQGKHKEALDNINNAVKSNPKSSLLFALRAEILVEMGCLDKGLSEACYALTINPDCPLAFKWRGRAYQLLGKQAEAYHDLAESCKIDFNEEADMWMRQLKKDLDKSGHV